MDGDAAKQDFEISSSDSFVPGRRIEIRAGYHDRTVSIFEGVVVRHAIQATSRRGSTLTIVAKHPAVALTLARRSRHFRDRTDTEAMREVLESHGLETAPFAETSRL